MARIVYFRSCLCCSLKTGVVSMAIAELILSVLMATSLSSVLINIDNQQPIPPGGGDDKNAYPVIFVILSGIAINCTFLCLLLFGIWERQTTFIKTWLIFAILLMGIQFIMFWVFVGYKQSGIALLTLIQLGLSFLRFFSVLSLHKELMEPTSSPLINENV